MGIHLTEQQQIEVLKAKRIKFAEGLDKLQDETGMTVVALLKASPTKLEAIMQIVPITQNEDGGGKTN